VSLSRVVKGAAPVRVDERCGRERAIRYTCSYRNGKGAAGGDMSGQGANGRSQSLYRKYRPTTFGEEQFVGQSHVSRTLRNAVIHDRVAHAYLFCGPRGSGKTSSARLLAKAVNCEHPEPAERPCNVCASCVAINEGRATDIIEIDAASNRGIDDMRDLREKARFAPAQLKKKFYIIDEVHQLTKDASNALLKTLEEPPPHLVFVLATTDQEKVLETISSRCQTFVFHRFPVEQIAAHLRRIATNEGIRADDAALAAIARAAGGAMRDALGLLDQLSAYGDSEEGITADTVRQILGTGGGEQVLTLVDAIAAADAAAGLRVINATLDDGADARQFTGQLVTYLRTLLHAAATPGREARVEESDLPIAPEHLAAFTLGEIAVLLKRFSQVDYGIRHSVYGHLPLELCLIDAVLARQGVAEPLAAPAPRALPTRAASRPTEENPAPPRPAAPERVPTPIRAEAAPPPRPSVAPTPVQDAAPVPPLATPAPREVTPPVGAPAASVTPSPPVPAPTAFVSTLTIEQVRDLWPRVRQGVRAINRRIDALLNSVDPHAIGDGTLTLVAVYDFHQKKINEDDTKRTLEEVVAQVLGGPYQLQAITRAEIGDASPLTSAPAVSAPVPAPAPVATVAPREPMSAPVAAVPPAPPPAYDGPADEPPWDLEPPAEEIYPETKRNAPTPSTRPQARATEPAVATYEPSGTPAMNRPTALADERYIMAVRNIFNAVEVKP
jgi:DNA polymerase-3 subunit gamma/tau